MGISYTLYQPNKEVEAGLQLDTDDKQTFSLGIGNWNCGNAPAIAFNLEIINLNRDDLQKIMTQFAHVFSECASDGEKKELLEKLTNELK